jgi:mycothiol synthase
MQSSIYPSIPAAPNIEGLIFRYFADPSDYGGMAAVRAGSSQHDGIDPNSARESVPSETDMRNMFGEEGLVGNPDLLLVAMNDQVIGYNHVFWRWTEVTGARVYLHLGYLLPQWRGKGIGTAMLAWAQQRIRAIAAEDQADTQATFATNVSSTEHEADALIRNAEYRDVRRMTDMLVTLEPPIVVQSLPTGVEKRAVRPEHYRAIYHVMKGAVAVIWTSTPESDADYQEFLDEHVNHSSFDPTLWQIAWSGEQVVGIVLCRISNGVGHIAEVEIHPDWQRQGIGRSLLQSAFATFAERGIAEVRLFTDAADGLGARRLYESLGFREVKQHIFYRKPLAPETT